MNNIKMLYNDRVECIKGLTFNSLSVMGVKIY